MPGRMESVENLHEAAVPGARIRGWFSTLPTAPWKSLTRFPQFHSPDDDDPLLRTSKRDIVKCCGWRGQAAFS